MKRKYAKDIFISFFLQIFRNGRSCVQQVKILIYLFTMKINAFSIRRVMNAFFGEKLNLILMQGKGDCDVFVAIDQKRLRKYIIKVVNKRKGAMARHKITTKCPENLYINPAERFKRAEGILSKLSKYGLSPRPIFFTDKFFVEEYIEGQAFSFIIATQRESMVKIFAEVLIAISKMHSLDISHADLNLDNIIVTDKGLKFIDFEHQLNPKVFTNAQINAFDYLKFMQNSVDFDKYRLIKENRLSILNVISKCLARDKITKDDIQKVIGVFKFDNKLMEYFYNI